VRETAPAMPPAINEAKTGCVMVYLKFLKADDVEEVDIEEDYYAWYTSARC